MLGIYKGKKVVVTGHTGFKGSWLAIWLRELGADILGFSLDPPTEVNNFDATNLKSKISHVYGDIRNYEEMQRVIMDYRPEFIFHLAAQPLVRDSYDQPRTTFDINIMGTVNVLEVARTCPSVRTVINVTSDKCYKNKASVWGYRENDELGGYDPYSNSKACSELVTSSYIESFYRKRDNFGIASVRAGNVIGGGDWGRDRIIPDCVRFLSDNKTVDIRNPHSVRPWQFVLEALYGYLLLGSRLYEYPADYTGAWNFGPANACCVPVDVLVNKVIKYWGSGEWKKVAAGLDNAKPEMNVLKLNCDKAYSYLNWSCVMDLESTVKNTVDWYKAFYNKSFDMYDYCISQIIEYGSKHESK